MTTLNSSDAATPAEAARSNGHGRRFRHGDHADQPAFEAWYDTTTEGFRAELIDGEVFVNTPASFDHAQSHGSVAVLLGVYASATPGVLMGADPSTILSDKDEFQPDAALRVDRSWGGASCLGPNRKIIGPPELVVEVSNTSVEIDIHREKRVYEPRGNSSRPV